MLYIRETLEDWFVKDLFSVVLQDSRCEPFAEYAVNFFYFFWPKQSYTWHTQKLGPKVKRRIQLRVSRMYSIEPTLYYRQISVTLNGSVFKNLYLWISPPWLTYVESSTLDWSIRQKHSNHRVHLFTYNSSDGM
jgi:hypothetical protein